MRQPYFILPIALFLICVSAGIPFSLDQTVVEPEGLQFNDDNITEICQLSRASEELHEEWSVRYNGAGDYIDAGNDIAADASGNVYVTGSSYGTGLNDPVTIKYDEEGNQAWLQRLGAGTSGSGFALVLDDEGNVYATGSCWGDYFTVKYTSAGNEVWLARYDGPAGGMDRAWDIALDKDGNAYVTGASGDLGYEDFATVKYDPDGNELWAAQYSGPGGGQDRASEIAVDDSGNVYVAGYQFVKIIDYFRDYDYVTIKYDTDGNQLWCKKYDGPLNGADYAERIVLDSENNVIVSGRSGVDDQYDYFFSYATVKYDSDGNQLWVAISCDYYVWDQIVSIGVDPLGNIYLTGCSGRVIPIVKYDPGGNELWTVYYNGSGGGFDVSSDIAIDEERNVYVTGRSDEGDVERDYNYITLKYDTDGNLLAKASYDGSGSEVCGHDYPSAIALDADKNIYVTGMSYGNLETLEDFATIKYSQAMIVDDADPEFVVRKGDLWPTIGYPDAYAGTTHYLPGGSGMDNIVAWRVDGIITPGSYDVYTWKFDHPRSSIMATNTQFLIRDRFGDLDEVLVDQSSPGDEWVYLGNYAFDSGSGQGVGVSDLANGWVAADAIKLVFTDQP